MISSSLAAALGRRDIHYGWVVAAVTLIDAKTGTSPLRSSSTGRPAGRWSSPSIFSRPGPRPERRARTADQRSASEEASPS
jgi:hypothetical protein